MRSIYSIGLFLSVLALGACCKDRPPEPPAPAAPLKADAAVVVDKEKPPAAPSVVDDEDADEEVTDEEITRFAKHHYELARTAYHAGKYQKTIKELKKTYLLDRRPLLLLNVARSYSKLGDHDNQIYYYKKYLALAPDNAPDRAAIAARIKALESNTADSGDTSFLEVAFPTSAKSSK
ncbi:MAG: hypothetical protein EXS55_04310 [Candidatus Magasanikbacteria bacterium]|nr:hypothetical protein [Candidatus Magasanikbacteria bacterium]